MNPFSNDFEIPKPTLADPSKLNIPTYNPDEQLPSNPTKPGAMNLPMPGAGQPKVSAIDGLNDFLNNGQAVASAPNNKTKAKSYGAGMDHHQFERYYNLPRVYSKLGFSPFRDNEQLYNKESTIFDEISRASTQWANLSNIGFKDAATFGDLTDTETARKFEKAMAIGASTKEGAGAFLTNLYLNSGYTMGIIGETALEEVGLALITAGSLGTSSPVTLSAMVGRGLNAGNKISKGYSVGKNLIKTLGAFKDAAKAKSYFTQAAKGAGQFLNPLENTVDFIQGMDKVESIGKLATTVNGFGSFYRDVRNIRLAWGESGLEGGMVRNTVEQELLQEHLDKNNGHAPTEEEANAIRDTAIKAGTTTAMQNVPAILYSNKIVFDNFRPLKKAFGKIGDEVVEAGVHGKIIRNKKLDVDPFEYVENNLKNSLKSLKNPKTYARTGLTFFKANLSEGLQETMQEVIGGAASDYYKNEWRGTPIKGGYYAAITDNLEKQVSAQGFETFMSGFLMGGLIQPVMAVPSYLRKKYTQVRNPEAYARTKQEKADYVNKTVNQLNELWNNTGDALMPDLDNLAVQDEYSKGMAEASAEGDIKAYYDLKNAAYFEHIHTALKMDRFDTFIERLEDQKQLSAEDIEQSFGMTQEEYFGAIDKAVVNANRIKDRYAYTQKNLKNPFRPQEYKQGTGEWVDELDNYAGWQNAQKKLIFLQDSFDNSLIRMTSIMGNAQTDAQLSKVSQSEFATLFDSRSVDAELRLLQTEVSAMEGATGDTLKIRKDKERKLKLLTTFNDKMNDLTEMAKSSDPKTTKDGKKAITKVKSAYRNYLKYLAEVNRDYAFDEALDNSFENLLDYYALDKETSELNKAINMLSDPGAFVKSARREAKIARERRANQSNEFRESLEVYLKAKESNDLLQLLYDEGYFFDTNELEALIKDGNMPNKFFRIPTGTKADIIEVTDVEEIDKIKGIIKDYVNNVMDVEIKEETPTETTEGTPAEPEPIESTGVKITKKDDLSKHPELASKLIADYKNTSDARIEDGNDPLDPNLDTKTDEQVLASIQFKNFYKASRKAQNILDDYNTTTGRTEEPIAEPVTAGEVTIMSTAMRNKLIELGYNPSDYNVAQATKIIEAGINKEQSDLEAQRVLESDAEILNEAQRIIRDDINERIAAANNLEELEIAEEAIASDLDGIRDGRTVWELSGYQAADLDALIKARKNELAFSFVFEDIYPGMTVIMNTNEKVVIDEVKGDVLHGHKANDITKLRKIKKSTVAERIKYIFKADMMNENVVVPTEETVTPADAVKSNESQQTVTTSERDAVNQDWLDSDTNEVDIDPNC